MTTIFIILIAIAIIALFNTVKASSTSTVTQSSSISTYRKASKRTHYQSGKWITKSFNNIYEADKFIQTLTNKYHLLSNNNVRYYVPNTIINNNLYTK